MMTTSSALAQAMADATAENIKAKVADEPVEDLSDTAEFPVVEESSAAPEEKPAEDLDSTRRIDFGNLLFGRDYEIK